MTKDEYISILNTNIAINSIVSGFSEKASGKMEGLQKAVELAKELDKSKIVTIPSYVAYLLTNDETTDLFDMINTICSNDWNVIRGSKLDEAFERTRSWIQCDHVGDFVLAFENGYEIEEPKYRVPLPNLNSDNGKQFITYKNGKWFACAHRNNLQQEFTEVELANLPEPYCDYERVEVKDND